MKECKKCRQVKAEDQFDLVKRKGRHLAAGRPVPLKKYCRECCSAMSEEILTAIGKASRQ